MSLARFVSNFTARCALWSNGDATSLLERPALTHRTTQWSEMYQNHSYSESIATIPATDQASERFILPSTGIQVLVDVIGTVCGPKMTMYSISMLNLNLRNAAFPTLEVANTRLFKPRYNLVLIYDSIRSSKMRHTFRPQVIQWVPNDPTSVRPDGALG